MGENCVYMIKSIDDKNTATYVGRTCNFERRIASHRTTCNNPNSLNYNFPVYKFIREFGGINNFRFILVKGNLTLDEATLLEATLIRDLNPYLNKAVPMREFKEYYNDNKEELQQKSIVRNYINRDECRKKWNARNEKNREYINNRMRIYRKENAEKIRKRDKTKYFCRCGKHINHRWIRDHLRGDAHKKGVLKFNTILEDQKKKICPHILYVEVLE